MTTPRKEKGLNYDEREVHDKTPPLESYFQAKQHAENAEDFAFLTEHGEGFRQNSRQKKAGTGTFRSGKPSPEQEMKYGRWAKEEAKKAHKARRRALRGSRSKK